MPHSLDFPETSKLYTDGRKSAQPQTEGLSQSSDEDCQLQLVSLCYLLPENKALHRLGNGGDGVSHAPQQHRIHNVHEEDVQRGIHSQHRPNHHNHHSRRRRSRRPYEGIELVLQKHDDPEFTPLNLFLKVTACQ